MIGSNDRNPGRMHRMPPFLPWQVGKHFGVLALLTMALTLVAVPSASATVPSARLWQAPEDGAPGIGAGELSLAEGLAANPSSGHIYAVDGYGNARISEFDAWGQFVKSWGWGVEDGSAELQTCGPGATPPTATCQAGIPGSGPGQISERYSGGIELDAAGNLYIFDSHNYRVEKFNEAGEFLLMFGKSVDKGPLHPGNVCTANFIAEGDSCGAGMDGSGNGEFESNEFGDHLAVGPSGAVFVGDAGRIQEFDPNGVFKSSIPLEGELANKNILSLVIASNGDFYVDISYGFGDTSPKGISKFSSSGTFLEFIPFPEIGPESALALDDTGNVYAVARVKEESEVVEFDSSGNRVTTAESGPTLSGNINSLVLNVVTEDGASDLYLMGIDEPGTYVVRAYGAPPDRWPPPKFPPEIISQFATSVNANDAVLGAVINPRFWADTRYRVEYGIGKCSDGGCASEMPFAPGTELGAGIVSTPNSVSINLSGLSSDTVYHYRFVASSGGGGPVHGVGLSEEEGSFTTPRSVLGPPNASCPNQALRTGASVNLPDCRAYEMVSPISKNNTDIVKLINNQSNLAFLDQSAIDGEGITYTTPQGFAGSEGTPYLSQYLARRGASGWENRSITPAQGLSSLPISFHLEAEYKVFSQDLCSGVLQHFADRPLTSDAPDGFLNLYQRSNCGKDGYEVVTDSAPPTRNPEEVPSVQGISEDGRCALFSSTGVLTANADPAGSKQVYERCDGVTRLISVMPSGKGSTSAAAPGTANVNESNLQNNDYQALSADGSRVYWTASGVSIGSVFVRVNAESEQSAVSNGRCTEEEKACTIKVSDGIGGGAAHFWGAAPDGSKAFITTTAGSLAGNLYQFDLESQEATLAAPKVTGVLGVGGEGSRVYFISNAAIGGPNSRGEAPSTSGANLYFYEKTEEGSRTNFIAHIPRDAEAAGFRLTPADPEPYRKTSRVSPDGRSVVFTSRDSLTGYDNTDAQNNQPDGEIYIYRAASESLHCASCDPTGQRPSGRLLSSDGAARFGNGTWFAAELPTYMNELYGSRVLSDDGTRVFFNSFGALLPTDTNGKADVYEWEVPGSGDCTKESSTYSPLNEGCLSLISSGESPADSEFVDASGEGRDVFFTTNSSLVPQDPGLIDIYDARSGGGYPLPAVAPPSCEGEACQGPLAPPSDPTPGSSSYEGPGNPPTANKTRKPKRKQHHRKRRRGANGKGRAGR